jgi:amidophosphoribosyltransferase
MSGIGYALGYHRQAGITYDEVYLYNRYSDRSYTPLEQAVRDRIADEKLSVIAEAVKGQRIILCDDSIVRGTQIKNKVKELLEAGAKEVHVRVGCPPLVAPCRYGISTRSYEELIARKHSVDEIRKKIDASTLRYNTLEDFVDGIGIPKNNLCLACWTGEYPL